MPGRVSGTNMRQKREYKIKLHLHFDANLLNSDVNIKGNLSYMYLSVSGCSGGVILHNR